MRPFLAFAKWEYGETVKILVEHGLKPEVGEWAIKMAARQYWRQFGTILFPVVFLGLPGSMLVGGLFLFGLTEEAGRINGALPLVVLLAMALLWIFFFSGESKCPNPLSLVADMLSVSSSLASLEGDRFTCAPVGYKWKEYPASNACLRSLKQSAESRSWMLAKKIALMAGEPSFNRTDKRWSYTARVLLRAVDNPLNKSSRNAAYDACARHIAHLHAGRLFDPVPRVGCGDLPELRPPRFKARLRLIFRTPTTYTVVATLVVAPISPLLGELLRHLAR